MKEPPVPEPGEGDDAALDAAIAWLIRLRDAQSGEVQAEFQSWLAASPGNGRAWVEANRVWALAGLALISTPDPDRS